MNERQNKIILFNPRSAEHNHRLPLSIMQVGASVYGEHDFVFVDGNLEHDQWQVIRKYLSSGEFAFFASTVMPGPQLYQAYRVTKAVRENFPGTVIIWGGYFPSNNPGICMESGMVDYLIRGQGDIAFPKLIRYLKDGNTDRLAEIGNLAYRKPGGKIIYNSMDPVPGQDTLPELPLKYFERFYPVEKYIVETFLGKRTLSYHSSIGCNHKCGFCGVASVYHGAWKGKSAIKIAGEILKYKAEYNIDAIEFHDSNFFCSQERVMEFCGLMAGKGIQWWAEGRIDTLSHYTDSELKLLRESGCRLVFMGAESGKQELIKLMNKGPAFHVKDTIRLVERLGQAGIWPQLSFVLGIPDRPDKMLMQAREDFRFIRMLKKKNPATEVILYIYNPVQSNDSSLSEMVRKYGFSYPSSLDEWVSPVWRDFELRRGKNLPWLKPSLARFIRNFEVVFNSAFPDVSNFQVSRAGRIALKMPGLLRYKLQWYGFPLELKAMLRLFNYQRPEKEGFYTK